MAGASEESSDSSFADLKLPSLRGFQEFTLLPLYLCPHCSHGDGHEQGKDGIAGMTVAKRSVSNVESQWKDEWERGDEKKVWPVPEIESNKAEEDADKSDGVPDDQESSQGGI